MVKKLFSLILALILLTSFISAEQRDWPSEKRFEVLQQPTPEGEAILWLYVADNPGPNYGIVDISIKENGITIAQKDCAGQIRCMLYHTVNHKDGGSYTYKTYVTTMETGKTYELPRYCCQHTLTFPRYEIKGTITYSINNIYNALVNLYQDITIFDSTTTDITGQYSLLGIPTGDYDLEIIKSGFIDQLIPVTTLSGINTKDITLIPASWSGTISGTVRDNLNNPITTGATVMIMKSGTPDEIQIVTTDNSGYYIINGLPTGTVTYDLIATANSYTFLAGPVGISLSLGETKTGQDIFLS